jgi:hypothetical protein
MLANALNRSHPSVVAAREWKASTSSPLEFLLASKEELRRKREVKLRANSESKQLPDDLVTIVGRQQKNGMWGPSSSLEAALGGDVAHAPEGIEIRLWWTALCVVHIRRHIEYFEELDDSHRLAMANLADANDLLAKASCMLPAHDRSWRELALPPCKEMAEQKDDDGEEHRVRSKPVKFSKSKLHHMKLLDNEWKRASREASRELSVGDIVDCRWRRPFALARPRENAEWWKAIVRRVHKEGECDIAFLNGPEEKRVPRKHIRKSAGVQEKQKQIKSIFGTFRDEWEREPVTYKAEMRRLQADRAKRKIQTSSSKGSPFAS